MLKEMLISLSEAPGDSAGMSAHCTAMFDDDTGTVIEFVEYITYDALNARGGDYGEMLRRAAQTKYEQQSIINRDASIGDGDGDDSGPDDSQAVGVAGW